MHKWLIRRFVSVPEQRSTARDPELQSPRGEALRLLLYVFGRDEAVRLPRAG